MIERLNQGSREVLTSARREAMELKHPSFAAYHILIALLECEDPLVRRILNYRKLESTGVRKFIKAHCPEAPVDSVESLVADSSADQAIRNALVASMSTGSKIIAPVHLLVGVLRNPDTTVEVALALFGVSVSDLMSRIENIDTLNAEAEESGSTGALPMRTPPNRGSQLEKYATDLVAMALEGRLDPVFGRDQEIDRIVTILSRRSKNNPVLIGEAGVGKTAVVEGLAQRIAEGDVPSALEGRSVWSLDIASLVGGTQYRGDFEERMKVIVKEAADTDGIIFVDEVHTLMGAGTIRDQGSNAVELIKPPLSRGELTMIGATTLKEYRFIEKDAALERRFAPVTIKAPTREETLDILKGLRSAYESHHGVIFTDAALEAAVKLSDIYLPDRQLPDKAIDILDEAGAAALLERVDLSEEIQSIYESRAKVQQSRREAFLVDDFPLVRTLGEKEKHLSSDIADLGKDVALIEEKDIAAVVASLSGIKSDLLTTDESERLMILEELLSSRVIGQSAAKAMVSSGVRRRRSGVAARRPDSYIFAGPTGVGKTELVKALAEVITGDVKNLVQVDMSEYAEKHTLSRLIGAPPGYAGYDEPGILTEAVIRRPASIILLDEIEKAHPDIFNIFLQVLEEGHLTDATGRKVDFSNTTLIFTTNLGAKVSKPLGFGVSGAEGESSRRTAREADTKSALKEHLRPEFMNRIDHTVVFDPLNRQELLAIASLMVDRVRDILTEKGIGLIMTPKALNELTDRGFDAEYGARPLRRTVQQTLEDSLSEGLLEGRFESGDTIIVDFDEDFTYIKQGVHAA